MPTRVIAESLPMKKEQAAFNGNQFFLRINPRPRVWARCAEARGKFDGETFSGSVIAITLSRDRRGIEKSGKHASSTPRVARLNGGEVAA